MVLALISSSVAQEGMRQGSEVTLSIDHMVRVRHLLAKYWTYSGCHSSMWKATNYPNTIILHTTHNQRHAQQAHILIRANDFNTIPKLTRTNKAGTRDEKPAPESPPSIHFPPTSFLIDQPTNQQLLQTSSSIQRNSTPPPHSPPNQNTTYKNKITKHLTLPTHQYYLSNSGSDL